MEINRSYLYLSLPLLIVPGYSVYGKPADFQHSSKKSDGFLRTRLQLQFHSVNKVSEQAVVFICSAWTDHGFYYGRELLDVPL
ncbi:hypothetical protein K470DRAFT_257814 [Piedraia hortae CBS 480.64]|uniref:Uncharacterized protein n=1 Tax=Piedraia hortae CBS 480.64 TaxID=1314780 RepID=A0A6A7C0W3_9PEZI|nr:hypothetical protein K470DRAFT_257814 [Piedraia hortae CBS 480.64]